MWSTGWNRHSNCILECRSFTCLLGTMKWLSGFGPFGPGLEMQPKEYNYFSKITHTKVVWKNPLPVTYRAQQIWKTLIEADSRRFLAVAFVIKTAQMNEKLFNEVGKIMFLQAILENRPLPTKRRQSQRMDTCILLELITERCQSTHAVLDGHGGPIDIT